MSPGAFRFLMLATLATGGCSLAPMAPSPPMPVPSAWDGAHSADPATLDLPATAFWSGFGSPALQELLERAARANPDLLIAADHLRLAIDTARVTHARQGPSLDFHAGPVDTAATSVAHAEEAHDAVFEVGLDASYELDLWGRLRSLSASADSEVEASAFDTDVARIGVASLLARGFFDVGEADEMLTLLERHLALAQERVALQAARHAAGRIDAATLAEARERIDAVEQARDQWQRTRRSGERQLALLLGVLPERFTLQAGPLRQCIRLPPVPAGLPSTLLQRRPDVRAAQARLDAARFRNVAARAEQFPQVRLTAQLGFATDVLHRIASGGVGLFGVGPDVRVPLYDGGARAAGADASADEADVALIEYQKTALTAFADVEKALEERESAQAQRDQAERVLDRRREAGANVGAQIGLGHKSRLDAIDAQEQVLEADRLSLESYRAQLDSLVDLYAALGGGWPQPRSVGTSTHHAPSPTRSPA